MIKKLFISTVVILTAVMARADGLTACIYYNGNLQEKVLLAKKPVLKMDGTYITLQLDESQTLEIPAIGTAVKFETASDETSIKSVSTPRSMPAYTITHDNVSISGLTPGQTARIYTIGGQQISATQVDANGCVSMPIGKGIMILKANNTSIKLINK